MKFIEISLKKYSKYKDNSCYINSYYRVTYIQKPEGYNKGPIRLISSETGKLVDEIAKDLSNKFGVEVIAPSGKI